MNLILPEGQNGLLEAPLIRQADGELKNIYCFIVHPVGSTFYITINELVCAPILTYSQRSICTIVDWII